MKKTKKYVAIVPKTGTICSYLTEGKEYPILSYESTSNLLFKIADNDGDIITCCQYGSNHLNGLDWIIKEVK